MKELNPDLLDDLDSLSQDPRFLNLMGWFHESKENEGELFSGILDEAELRQAQGRHQVLSEILQALRTAGVQVQNIRRNDARGKTIRDGQAGV